MFKRAIIFLAAIISGISVIGSLMMFLTGNDQFNAGAAFFWLVIFLVAVYFGFKDMRQHTTTQKD